MVYEQLTSATPVLIVVLLGVALINLIITYKLWNALESLPKDINSVSEDIRDVGNKLNNIEGKNNNINNKVNNTNNIAKNINNKLEDQAVSDDPESSDKEKTTGGNKTDPTEDYTGQKNNTDTFEADTVSVDKDPADRN